MLNFYILFEELFSFELSFNGEEDDADEEVEDLENYDLNIQYLANNNDSNFDINHFMYWTQMTFYKELIQEKKKLEENNNDDINDDVNNEYINHLNEVLDLMNDIKNNDLFDNFVDAISINLFYGQSYN